MKKNLFRKYWWILLIIIFIPIGLNWLIIILKNFNLIENNPDWLNFWVSYISAAASFAMVYITWYSLKQNKDQITELKNQWKEQNSPKVYCSLEKDNEFILLVLSNPTSNVATNVHVNIKSFGIKETKIYNKYTTLLEETIFTISPLQKKYINLYISAFSDDDYSKRYIDVTIKINDKMDTYRLYLQEINLIKSTTNIANN